MHHSKHVSWCLPSFVQCFLNNSDDPCLYSQWRTKFLQVEIDHKAFPSRIFRKSHVCQEGMFWDLRSSCWKSTGFDDDFLLYKIWRCCATCDFVDGSRRQRHTLSTSRRVARGGNGGGNSPPPIPKVAPKILRLIKYLMCKPKKYFTAQLQLLVEPDQSSMVY